MSITCSAIRLTYKHTISDHIHHLCTNASALYIWHLRPLQASPLLPNASTHMIANTDYMSFLVHILFYFNKIHQHSCHTMSSTATPPSFHFASRPARRARPSGGHMVHLLIDWPVTFHRPQRMHRRRATKHQEFGVVLQAMSTCAHKQQNQN